ncbi:MAG: hypothetical protein LBR08_05585 [Bacteroidales bacterium]|jgi:hypothetical protein|nr:hypothetical protein [Bacteroidales bacterium]
MKASRFLRTGLSAAMLLLLSAGAFAQSQGDYSWWRQEWRQIDPAKELTPPNDTSYVMFQETSPWNESRDTVTIGSRMAYKMLGDTAIARYVSEGKLHPSQFKWVFKTKKNIGGPAYTGAIAVAVNAADTFRFTKYQGLTTAVNAATLKSELPFIGPPAYPAYVGNVGGTYDPAADLTGRGYFHDLKEINVKYSGGGHDALANVAVGDSIMLLVNEIPVSTADVPMCEGVGVDDVTDSIAIIHVVDVPELRWKTGWDHKIVACASDSISFGVNVELLGYGPWVVRYKIEKTVGSDIYTSPSDTTVVGIAGSVGTSTSPFTYLTLPGSQFKGGPGDKFEVTILDITDRFSRKSLDYLPGRVPAGMSGSGDDDDPTFEIELIPQPQTKRLQHVRNRR